MKPCNDNNGATIHAGRAATVHNPFCYARSCTLQLNILTEKFLLVGWANALQKKLWSVHVRAKNANKNI